MHIVFICNKENKTKTHPEYLVRLTDSRALSEFCKIMCYGFIFLSRKDGGCDTATTLCKDAEHHGRIIKSGRNFVTGS